MQATIDLKGMSRWRAAAIHLAVCCIVAALVAAVLFGLWYPPPYFHAAGADRLLLLIAGVDLVLGPLLTLIVFRSGKPSLRFDLTMIGLVQVAALTYGLHVLTQARPVFLVGSVDRFVLVSASQLSPGDLATADPVYRGLSWTGPRLVGATLPTDADERNTLLNSALQGKDIERLPRYYVDYRRAASALLKHARPLASLRRRSTEANELVGAWLAEHAVPQADLAWLPVTARGADLVMLVRRTNGEPVGALPLDPW
ncbi:TfpX/TfpZ family type IV pilin accessory protein [Lysobacter soli]|uniref:TfpX/TfpZ family type IV pilin accessory protein n=1 Tax=Lysobacter soli TaxID=453783 RepID=UPI0036B89A5D